MKVRIGIDVGGTFTDAVAIDNETYQLVGKAKVPTTHDAKEGVALGIVQVLQKILQECDIRVADVVFLAHGTTQATNALLEGDVVKVGILAVGSGIEGMKAKADSNVGQIELAPGHFLETIHRYMDIADLGEDTVRQTTEDIVQQGGEVLVAGEAYSVDRPEREQLIIGEAEKLGMAATGTHEISKLYGLKTRTRTAVINASILPKMIETANMTENSVKKAGIQSSLMIMRCDGGVMDVNEVRSRPILTMLSGPAAGVAGALMYEKVSDGIFLEVGGTSTDISVIRNGKVMVEYAEVGGHKTYVNSLDVRTVGIAGGSMVRVESGQVYDVGPRSAHIAGLPYAVFTDPARLANVNVIFVQPRPGDPNSFVALENEQGEQFAITLACAANYLGYVSDQNYAYGNPQSAQLAFEALARELNSEPKRVAAEVMQKASVKNKEVLERLIKEYELDPHTLVLIGGGGGAAAVVPHLAETMNIESRIAKNAEVISPIGVALAMVREVVERFIPEPSENDILLVRKEAEEAVVRAGAKLETVEVHVEVDRQQNVVRATATGATELRTKEIGKRLSEQELQAIVARALKSDSSEVTTVASTGELYVIRGTTTKKALFGLWKKKVHPVRVIDQEGVIRLQKNDMIVEQTTVTEAGQRVKSLLEKLTVYGDGGVEVPDTYVLYGKRIIDCSGVTDVQQILSLLKVELEGATPQASVAVLVGKRG